MDELLKLKEENRKLKKLLNELGYTFIDEEMVLSKEKRIEIFMNYFKGRNDVYASKYFNKKLNKFSYSFECQNKFKKNICPISRKGKCNTDCTYYNPISLTKSVYLKHMQEKNNSIGIYPLLADNTCFFLAIDFDDDLWFENLLCVYRTAKKNQISCIMERSQSGNGGHLWIFFENAIKSSKARMLGDFLLKEAMHTNKHISFQAFDRMFPSQDYLSGNGLGNLIAMPLQYEAMLNKNSLFINEFEQPITKPFHFLLSTVKVKEAQIDFLVQTQQTQFKDYFDDNPKLQLLDSISQSLEIVEDSLLHISKKDLNAKTLLTIRKISSTYNPEFYERLRLHLSIYQIPRVLCEYMETDKEISIPRGLKEKLFEYVNQDLINYHNHTHNGLHIDISFKGSLRPQQQLAVDTLIKHEIAILEAIPGFGKTIIALYLMSIIQVSTLIIVHSKELLLQWKSKIDEFIDYPKAKLKRDHYIGEYYSNKKKMKFHIDIALIQSLSKLEDMSILQNYGLVIIDECHHASSDTFRTVLRYINARYIYSFSGTPQRKDQLDKITYMYLGNVVYKTKKSEIIKNRKYDQILIPRMTTFKIIDQDISFTEICNELYQNQKRNYLIVKDVFKEIKENKNIIILTDRKEHILTLYKELKYYDYNIYCLSGDNSGKERKLIIEKIHNSHHYLIIATSQLVGEGFDLPSLNTMFITMPISYSGRLSQYVGRLHRDYDDKQLVKVYDYVDINVKVLQNMFNKRLKAYKTEGYKTIENNDIVLFDQVIFDKANHEHFLQSNLLNAQKSIVLFVNECKNHRIQKLYSLFISILSRGVKIYICINKLYDQDIYNYLEGICTKILETKTYMNAIMIDEKSVWTSSCSYLGSQNNDLFYLRTTDEAIIEELKSNIID